MSDMEKAWQNHRLLSALPSDSRVDVAYNDFCAGYTAAQSQSGWDFDMDKAPRDGTWIEIALYYPDLGPKQVKQQNAIVRWSSVVPHWVNNHNYCVDSQPRHGPKSSAYAWGLSDAPHPPKSKDSGYG